MEQQEDTLTEQQMWDEATTETSAATAAQVVPPEPVAPTEEVQEEEDPFAGLSPKVRAMLEDLNTKVAELPVLKHKLQSAEGRVAALQKTVPQATAAKERPRFEKVEALREDLPEVSAALEEIIAAHSRQSEPDETQLGERVRAQVRAEMEERALEDKHPGWAQTLTGNDFQLWLGAQAPEFRQMVQSTDRASEMSAALDAFDAFQQKVKTPAASRAARVAAAAVPQSGVRRAQAKAEDAMTDEEYWAHITQDS